MSDYIGSRISLISKSDIRYVGTLASINSDDSTVSLENVRTFGTEGRKGKIEEEVPASDQVYEYIVFRGTDVKDLRIEEGPAAKENKPPAVPNDPAIVGARPRPGNVAPGPPGGPQGPPQGPGPIGHPSPHGAPNQQQPPPGAPGYGYFPPHMGGWGGRPGPGGPQGPGGPSPGPVGPGGPGGPSGPGPFGMPYPQPGWFPPGQEYPPMVPGQWNPYSQFPPGPGGPGGPPGFPAAPGAPGQGRQSANQTPSNQGPGQKPAPIGPSGDKKSVTPGHNAQSSESKPMVAPPQQSAGGPAPPPPVASKPTAEEVKATAVNLAQPAAQEKGIPTGPKSDRPVQILPVVPLPVGLTSRVAQPSPSATRSTEQNNAGATPAALRDATQAAKEAVANAMAQMENNAFAQIANQGAAVDNLTKKVNEMRVNAARGGQSNRGGGGRGRGGARPAAKVEVPDSDYDFATANAKFNKQDLVREAIAGGSPIVEAPAAETAAPEAAVESAEAIEPAYNKQRSFFDNISSDLKDRENASQKPGGREWRGEEQRKNIETFGQGSVDGGYRGYRGGRGRGRGGRGRSFRGGRGGNNGYRPRDSQQQQAQPPQ